MPAKRSPRGRLTKFCATQLWRRRTSVNRIILKDVEAGYGAARVLHHVSLLVNEGETVVLLGTNGNGKSTLMGCIMGLVEVEAGEIFLEADGQRINLVGKAPEEVVNLGISLVPEG